MSSPLTIISSPGFRNVWVLTLSNALAASIMTLMILVGSLVGAKLAPSAQWATLPIALTVIGTAISILPATACMQRLGRKRALWAFMGLGIFACWLASSALEQQSFTLFCIAAVLLGSTNAALQQTRFAAMESVAPESAATAASLMMCGGILAAIIGPELAVAGAHLTPVDYQGSYWLAAVTVILGAVLLAFYKPTPIAEVQRTASTSSTLSIIRNPTFILAVTSGAVAFVVMSFVMTGTPISMHHVYGHSLADTKWVIQSHIAAMFLPSLIAPLLFNKLGIKGMMATGLACYCGTIGIGYFDISVSGFWLQLVLLGIGWNFLFVSGTALLPRTYQERDKFKGQAINDLTVFTFQALASVSAGWALGLINWQQMLLLCLLPILMMGVMLLIEGRINRRDRHSH
jgi:MFS family permease|tara:strand:+ start:4901 stop:6109 length:1209 start_codon:yes stop_codon:yes gene_type:complete